jgi:hypothetical protein
MNYFTCIAIALMYLAVGINTAVASNECLEVIENQFSIHFLFELDEPLALHEGEDDTLVTLKGELQRRDYFEENGDQTKHYWVLKLTPESFKLAIQTPVLMAYQTPKDIMEWRNYNEVQLGGAYDQKDWLYAHLNKHVSMQGVLFHAHTGHHHTPIQMDIKKVND